MSDGAPPVRGVVDTSAAAAEYAVDMKPVWTAVPVVEEPTLGLLLQYQAKWVADPSPVKVAEKSRRIGLTWAEAADDVLIAAASKSAGGQNVYYIGYNLEMAREYIDTCARWAKGLQGAAAAIGEELLSDTDEHGETREIKAYRIDFPSGFAIKALSSRPRSLRGMQGVVVIDEGAFHDDLAGMMKAAFALLIWGGKVRIISTHFGSANAFNELIVDIRGGRKPYSLHRIDFDEALRDGLYRRIAELTGKTWSAEAEKAWRDGIVAFYAPNEDEELFCIPAEGEGAYLPLALLEARARDDIPVLRWTQPRTFMMVADILRRLEALRWLKADVLPVLKSFEPGEPSWFGMDFGRYVDLSVIWLGQTSERMRRRTRLIIELGDIPFTEQETIAKFVIENVPRFSHGKIDRTGNGAYLGERLLQGYGEARIEPIHLSEPWYRDHWPKVKAAWEDGLFDLPRNREIIEDLRTVRTIRGVARVPDIRRQAGQTIKRHGDAAIAAVLAYAASDASPWAADYESAVGSRRDRYGDGAGERRSFRTVADFEADDARTTTRRSTW